MTDLTIAVSENTFADVFATFRDTFEFAASDSVDDGPFTAGYDVEIELQHGSVDLRSPNEIRVEELDIFFRTLRAYAGIDISRRCFGGWCIIPIPFDGCVRAPRKCLFTDDPDFGIDLDLSDFLTSEVTFTAKTTVAHAENHPPSVSYLAAQETSPPSVDEWEVYIDPDEVDVDLVDVADTVGNLVENAIDDAIDSLLGPVPGVLKDLVKAFLKPIIDTFRSLLDLGDDLFEWISDFLGQTLGLFNTLAEAVADFLLADPIFTIEDPYPILDPDPGVPLIPVKLPIADLSVSIDDVELVVTADIGPTP